MRVWSAAGLLLLASGCEEWLKTMDPASNADDQVHARDSAADLRSTGSEVREIDRAAAVRYALKFAKSVDENVKLGHMENEASFISRVLLAAGWPPIVGAWNPPGFAGAAASTSWTDASELYQFALAGERPASGRPDLRHGSRW
jgi:hypothetical protein